MRYFLVSYRYQTNGDVYDGRRTLIIPEMLSLVELEYSLKEKLNESLDNIAWVFITAISEFTKEDFEKL